MAIDIINGFHVGATAPIDDRFLLSKAQMLAFNDNIAPQSFLCCCADDNKVYQYTKTNTADVTTGKFRIFESGGSDKVVFLDLPAQEDWEDEEVTRVFYNSLKSAIDDGKYVVVVETSEGDFDCWLYYTVAYNVVDSDDEFIGLQVFDGTYTYAIEVTPTNITRTEREIKSDIEIEFDKTDINSVYNQLLSNFITANPVLFEEVEHADYYWKFINAEAEEDTGAITGFVFLCSKKGELHKLVIEPYDYQDITISTQVSEMPTANASNVGQIVQYVGTTDTSYTNGYFYKCVEITGTSTEYTWQNINVQAGGSGGDVAVLPYPQDSEERIAFCEQMASLLTAGKIVFLRESYEDDPYVCNWYYTEPLYDDDEEIVGYQFITKTNEGTIVQKIYCNGDEDHDTLPVFSWDAFADGYFENIYDEETGAIIAKKPIIGGGLIWTEDEHNIADIDLEFQSGESRWIGDLSDYKFIQYSLQFWNANLKLDFTLNGEDYTNESRDCNVTYEDDDDSFCSVDFSLVSGVNATLTLYNYRYSDPSLRGKMVLAPVDGSTLSGLENIHIKINAVSKPELIKPEFIPIDDETIKLSPDGKLTSVSERNGAYPAYDSISFSNFTESGNTYIFDIDNERCRKFTPSSFFVNYNDSGEYATISKGQNSRQYEIGAWSAKLIDEDEIEMTITCNDGQVIIESSSSVNIESIEFEYEDISIDYTDDGKIIAEGEREIKGETYTEALVNADDSQFIELTTSNSYTNVIEEISGFSGENIPITRDGFLNYSRIANYFKLFSDGAVFITDDQGRRRVNNNVDIYNGFDYLIQDDTIILSFEFTLENSVRKYKIFVTIIGCEFDSDNTHVLSADSISLCIGETNSYDNRHVIVEIQVPHAYMTGNLLYLRDEYASLIPSIIFQEREFCKLQAKKISVEKELNVNSSNLKYTAFNDLGTISEDITLTFDEIAIDKYVEYNGRFTTDATHTVTFPAGVVMTGNTSQKANTTYEFSIVNGYGIILEVVTTGGETQPFAMIDDTNVSTSSAYSSSKIDELIGDIETLLEAL